LDAVIAAGTTSAGTLSLLARPSLRLGIFALERFHHAVRHWSRLREFAADSAGAGVTTSDAAARALLRTAASEARIDETLDAAFQTPEAASTDLVAAALHHAIAQGLDDPGPRLEKRQPHPTDTHPPTRQRLVALGREPDPAMLAQAALPPSIDAQSCLSALFAEPDALCRTATADFLDMARGRARAMHQALEDAAAAVDGTEFPLHENRRSAGYVYIGAATMFVLAGAALLVFGMQGLSWQESKLVSGVAAAIGLAFAGWGLIQLRTRRPPFLLLRPDAFTLTGLDRPIAWEHVTDLDMVLDRSRISTRMLLSPEAPFPARTAGRRRIKLDRQRRIVTFTAGLPRGMKAQGYADLLARYRTADLARRELAGERAQHPDKE
ncbi:MAG: hypothetical protein ACRYF2_23120, partial [Janthinobacterium lividum]